MLPCSSGREAGEGAGERTRMKPKAALTILLLAFVGASIAYLVADSLRGRDDRSATASRPTTEPAGHRVVVTFFYFLPRCTACNTIEAYAREAVETGFGEDLAAGRVVWRAVDYERSENRHFIEDFDLITKSVVLTEVRDGRTVRWKTLARVWDLLDDKAAYTAYVQDELRAFLGEVSWSSS